MAVKSRLVITAFNELLRAFFLPFLERQDRGFAVDSALRNVMVVQFQIVHQGRLQVGPAGEAGLLQNFVDAAVESFDHAIRLRVPWR